MTHDTDPQEKLASVSLNDIEAVRSAPFINSTQSLPSYICTHQQLEPERWISSYTHSFPSLRHLVLTLETHSFFYEQCARWRKSPFFWLPWSRVGHAIEALKPNFVCWSEPQTYYVSFSSESALYSTMIPSTGQNPSETKHSHLKALVWIQLLKGHMLGLWFPPTASVLLLRNRHLPHPRYNCKLSQVWNLHSFSIFSFIDFRKRVSAVS